VLGSAGDGKASLVVRVTDDLTGRVQAGKLVNEIAAVVGGKGGGKPDMAMAGGKEPEKLDAALDRAYAAVAEILG
jgi:alanyl-tRNA synthetase